MERAIPDSEKTEPEVEAEAEAEAEGKPEGKVYFLIN